MRFLTTILGSKCQACRFDQCVRAGMNPKLIQYPDDMNVDEIAYKVDQRKRKLLEEPEMIPECSKNILA